MAANHEATSSVDEEAPSVDKDEKKESSRKSKKNEAAEKKEAVKFGSFLVEAKPAERDGKTLSSFNKKNESFWQRLAGDDEKSESKSKDGEEKSADIAIEAELDSEASLLHLTRIEEMAINQNISRIRSEEIAAELADAEPDSIDARVAEAAKEFHELDAESGDPDASRQIVLERFKDVETAAKAITTASEELKEPIAELPPEGETEAEAEVDPNDLIDVHIPVEGEILLNPPQPAEDDLPAASGTGGVGSVPPRPPQASPSSPSPSSGPPNFTQPPSPPLLFSSPGGGGSANFNLPAAPNIRPANNPNVISTDDAYYYERRALSRGLLVGGIVGYLIGRRRGRIKTEKKLRPIQKKLEKEVKSLQSRLIESETTIREAVRAHAEIRQKSVPESPRLARATPEKPAKETKSTTIQEKIKLKPDTKATIRSQAIELAANMLTVRERAPILEAQSLHAPKIRMERIGHVLVSAEASTSSSLAKIGEAIDKTTPAVKEMSRTATRLPELAPAEFTPGPEVVRGRPSSDVETAPAEQRIAAMSRAEIMDLSRKIVIDGTSLLQVYETHLVSERGLRRLLTEYASGGNVKRALRRELIEREIDFERDPILRDRARKSVNGAGKGALHSLLREAGAAKVISVAPSKLNVESPESNASVPPEPRTSYSGVDIVLVSIIVFLLLLIILFIVYNH